MRKHHQLQGVGRDERLVKCCGGPLNDQMWVVKIDRMTFNVRNKNTAVLAYYSIIRLRDNTFIARCSGYSDGTKI